MPASFRAAGAAQQTNNSLIKLPAPAGVTAGDLLLAVITVDRTATISPPSSAWTVLTSFTPNGSSYTTTVLTKPGAASDSGASFQFTLSTTAVTSGFIADYAAVTGVDATAWASTSGYSGQVSPTITTAHAGELIVEVWSARQTSGAAGSSLSAPASARLGTNNNAGIGFAMLALSDQTQPSAGQSTSVTATCSTSNVLWSAVTIGLYGNSPPNAPALNSPPNNQPLDCTSPQQFSWTFSDPDAGDSQSAFDIRYCAQGGSFPSSPQVSVTSPNAMYTFAAQTFTSGTSYQWQVRTYDSSGAVGPWSASGFFTAQTPPSGPTITYPTSGGTVQQSDQLRWSYPTQSAFQVQVCADNNGAIDTSTVDYDSGTVTDPGNSIRSQALSFPTNNIYVWLRLRIQNNGLWSAWVQIRVQVSYSPPPTPTFVTAAGTPNAAAMTVFITTGAPGSGQPAATSVDVAASPDGGVTVEWQRSGLPINGQVIFWTPQSGAAYSIRVTAHADNGTSSTSGWSVAYEVVDAGDPSSGYSLILDGGSP